MTARALVPAGTVAGVIARRDALGALRGLGVYVALALAVAAAAWLLLIDVRALAAAGILVPQNPFRAPLDIALLVVALFFAVTAAVSTARDRETGTLEVLFYGPVDEPTYVLGKVGGLVLAYVAILPLLLAAFWLLSLVSGFALPGAVLAGLVLSVVPVAMIVAFAVLLAVGTSRIRTAVLLLVGAVALLLGVSVAYDIVLLIPIANPSSPVLPLRDALAAVDAVFRWVSPFAYLERIVESVGLGAWRSLAVAGASALAYTAALLVLASVWLRRRGVQRSGE